MKALNMTKTLQRTFAPIRQRCNIQRHATSYWKNNLDSGSWIWNIGRGLDNLCDNSINKETPKCKANACYGQTRTG